MSKPLSSGRRGGERPLLSIIIPVYKVREYLRRCLDSVLSQTGEDMEVLLIDDGSPDDCGAICDEYGARYPGLVTVIHQENRGVSDARNNGLYSCSGEYVFFIDSDDYIVPGALAAIRDALAAHAFPDMLVFHARFVGEDGRTLFNRIPSCLPDYRARAGIVQRPQEEKELLLEYHGAWCRVTRRRIFLDHGIRFPSGIWYEDLAVTPALVASCRTVVYLDDALYVYLRRAGSIMTTRDIERMQGDMLRAFEHILGFFRTRGLFDLYLRQLEFLAIHKILMIHATSLVRRGCPRHVLRGLTRFVTENFSDYRKNPYLPRCPLKDRLKAGLMGSGRHRLFGLILRMKNL